MTSLFISFCSILFSVNSASAQDSRLSWDEWLSLAKTVREVSIEEEMRHGEAEVVLGQELLNQCRKAIEKTQRFLDGNEDPDFVYMTAAEVRRELEDLRRFEKRQTIAIQKREKHLESLQLLGRELGETLRPEDLAEHIRRELKKFEDAVRLVEPVDSACQKGKGDDRMLARLFETDREMKDRAQAIAKRVGLLAGLVPSDLRHRLPNYRAVLEAVLLSGRGSFTLDLDEMRADSGLANLGVDSPRTEQIERDGGKGLVKKDPGAHTAIYRDFEAQRKKSNTMGPTDPAVSNTMEYYYVVRALEQATEDPSLALATRRGLDYPSFTSLAKELSTRKAMLARRYTKD